MSLEPHLAFYNSQVLGQKGSLERIIDFLNKEKYDLFNSHVGSLLKQDEHWDKNFQLNDLEKAYEKNNISFNARNKEAELELLVQLNWNIDLGDGNKHAYVGAVTFQTTYFYPSNEAAIYYSKLFLDFGKALYSTILPDFGWIDFQETAGSTWFDEIEQVAFPQLYWANFLGAGYIAKYGMGPLLNTPSWLTETLSDHGCLIVLSPILGQNDEAGGIKEYLERLSIKRSS